MAEEILEKTEGTGGRPSGASSKSKTSPARKFKKRKEEKKVKKDHKEKDRKDKADRKHKKGKKSKAPTSSSSTEELSDSQDSQDPEKVMSSLALQLGLSGNTLKLKGSKVMKIEDLSPDQLQFIMADPPGLGQHLGELSTFTLFETGGELYQLRRAATVRLQARVGKKKVSKDLEKNTQAEVVCLGTWKKRLLDIYELLADMGLQKGLSVLWLFMTHDGFNLGRKDSNCSSSS